MNKNPEENLPLDEDMVNRATKAMEALVGPLLAGQADNPYLDAEQYTKALCKAYAEQVLNAAFHGLGRIEWATKEQAHAERNPLYVTRTFDPADRVMRFVAELDHRAGAKRNYS